MKTYKKGRLFRNLGGIVSTVSSLTGRYNLGGTLERGADILSERFHGMSPDWHKEHEAAFALAQNEAKGRFHRCPKCRKWVCPNDWNEQEGLCVECAPRVNVEIASAKAQRMVEEIQEEASKAKVFHGKIESKQTLCPQCGKPAGKGSSASTAAPHCKWWSASAAEPGMLTKPASAGNAATGWLSSADCAVLLPRRKEKAAASCFSASN